MVLVYIIRIKRMIAYFSSTVYNFTSIYFTFIPLIVINLFQAPTITRKLDVFGLLNMLNVGGFC